MKSLRISLLIISFAYLPVVQADLTDLTKSITRFFVDKKTETGKTFIAKKFLELAHPSEKRTVNLVARKFLKPVIKKRMLKAQKGLKKPKASLLLSRNYDRKIFPIPPIPYNKKYDRDPAILYYPNKHKSTKPTPLIVSLHGYSGGQWIADYFLPLADKVSKKGYILAVPSGTKDKFGNQFWNGTNICCDWYKTKVDDVGYITNLITSIKKFNKISKVIVIGHSNGGFMAHRYACDTPLKIHGIISWGGSNYYNPRKCRPNHPVNILHLHGDKDLTIPYRGKGQSLPSAPTVVKDWAKRFGCSSSKNMIGPYELEVRAKSNQARAIDYIGYQNCKDNKKVILGTVKDGNHTNPIHGDMFDFILNLTIGMDFNFNRFNFHNRATRKAREAREANSH